MLLITLVWPLPVPGLFLTLRSREETFCPALGSGHWSLPAMSRNPGGGPDPAASFHEQCGQDPCKNICDKKLKPGRDVWFALDASQTGRLPECIMMAVGWQLLLALQDGLCGQFERVILYRQLAYPPTTRRKLSNCLLCEQGALFSAVTWKWQVFPVPLVMQLFCWLKIQLS